MNITHKTLPGFTLMGLATQTTNQNEQNLETGKIGPLIQRYMGTGVGITLPHRAHPGVTYALYTAYESDHQGPYTYLFGEAVNVDKMNNPPPGLTLREIPAQTYAVITVGPGPIPMLIIQAWQSIWQMSDPDLGGKRSYVADFERYDARAANPALATVDIYIGIHPLKE